MYLGPWAHKRSLHAFKILAWVVSCVPQKTNVFCVLKRNFKSKSTLEVLFTTRIHDSRGLSQVHPKRSASIDNVAISL